MATRWMAMGVLGAVACTGGEPTGSGTPPVSAGVRLERLANLAHDDGGVVPAAEGVSAWIAREGGLDRVDGRDGSVAERIEVPEVDPEALQVLDGSADGWLVASAGEVSELAPDGSVRAAHPVEGDVLAGRFDGQGWVALVGQGGVCDLHGMDAAGMGRATLDVPCGLGGDLHGWSGGAAVRVAVEPSGRTFAVEPGTRSVEVREGGELTDRYELQRVAVDVAARAGLLFVLSDDAVMTQLDPDTGRALAERQVHRPEGIGTIALTGDGSGVALTSPEQVVFFAVDLEAPGYLLPDHPDFGTQPGTSPTPTAPFGLPSPAPAHRI